MSPATLDVRRPRPPIPHQRDVEVARALERDVHAEWRPSFGINVTFKPNASEVQGEAKGSRERRRGCACACDDGRMDSDHTELIPLSDPGDSFDVVLRGYDRGQVEEHVERLEAALRIAAGDRDAAAARSADLASQLGTAHGEIESLRARLEQTGLPTFENMGERIAGMLRLAEAEANAIRQKAVEDTAAQRAELSRLEGEIGTIRAATDRDAAALITEAEQRAEASRREADGYSARTRGEAEEHAQRVRGETDEYAARVRGEADAQAQQLRSEAETHARRLVNIAQTERDQAGADFEIALRSRRTEESRADRERRANSLAEAARRVAEAQEQADQLVAEARRQVEELDTARAHVLEQLATIGRLVADIPGRLDSGTA